jgi:hypothetical protein
MFAQPMDNSRPTAPISIKSAGRIVPTSYLLQCVPLKVQFGNAHAPLAFSMATVGNVVSS